MTDAPERIWAGRWPHGGRAWRDAPAVHIKTEYIRADLVEAMEAENQRLRLALRIIAGYEQCLDNLMSNIDVARAALNKDNNQ